jgi:hypothetical protein
VPGLDGEGMKYALDYYLKENLSLIPVPFKEKGAIIKWQEYQSRKATDEEIQKWFMNGHQTNLAVVCGAISENLVVLDCDTSDKFYELSSIICEKTGTTDIIDYTTIVRTSKGCHIYFKTDSPVKSMKFPNLDIKGEGGYVIGPPSIHPSGAEYKFISDTGVPPIRHIKSLKDIGIDVEQKPPEQQPTNQPGWVSQLLQGVGQGGRNDAGAKLAGYFRNIVPIDVLATILENWNLKNSPPLPPQELNQIIRSAERYQPRRDTNVINTTNNIYNRERDTRPSSVPKQNVTENVTENVTSLSDRIDDWVCHTSAWFDTSELDKELGIVSQKDKDNRRQVLCRLEEKKLIERHFKENKKWRFVNRQLEELNYKQLAVTTPLPIVMPLGISELVNLHQGNLVVLAGTTNAGKTAFALEIIRLNNTSPMACYYFYSEGGAHELRDRLDKCPGMSIEEWKFKLFSRATNFADVIAPDCLNVIDYLELTDDFYLVNKHLTDICNRIGTGLAVVCIQKKKLAEFARGGELSAEKARLYIALDEAEGQSNARAKIVKGKSWAKKGHNPNGQEATFHITDGWIESNNVGWGFKQEGEP